MAQTVYGSFPDATQAEQAAGALLDYGVQKEDLSVVANESYRQNAGQDTAQNTVADAGYRGGETRGAVMERTTTTVTSIDPDTGREDVTATSVAVPDYNRVNIDRPGSSDRLSYGDALVADRNAQSATVYSGNPAGSTAAYGDPNANTTAVAGSADRQDRRDADDDRDDNTTDIDGAAKSGISVTTPGDAAAGAAKGAGWGLGIGVLAGIACLIVPGVGWVIGGGALATAIGAAIGTTVAGGVAGGVLGYLKDQGVPDVVATDYDKTIRQGGAMLAVATPSNGVDSVQVEGIMRKYGATNVNAY